MCCLAEFSMSVTSNIIGCFLSTDDVAVELLGQLEGHPETPAVVPQCDRLMVCWASNHQRGELQCTPSNLRSLSLDNEGGNTKARHVLNWPTERRSDPAKAVVRSHGGPGAGLALLICPVCRLIKLDPHLFRVVPPLPQSLASAPSPNRAFLPVWPSPPLCWPSPRSMRTGRGSGQKGSRFGKRGGTNMP